MIMSLAPSSVESCGFSPCSFELRVVSQRMDKVKPSRVSRTGVLDIIRPPSILTPTTNSAGATTGVQFPFEFLFYIFFVTCSVSDNTKTLCLYFICPLFWPS